MILSLIFALLISASVAFGIIHQQQVKAERILQEKQETGKIELKMATSAVDTAYQTRSDKDIKNAETALSKLGVNNKTEQTKLTGKLTKLKGFLKQISDINTTLTKAIQSKSEQDIKETQTLIDKENNTYLKNDKVNLQNRLNALITLIAEEKADADAKVAAEETKRQADTAAARAVQPATQPAYTEAPSQSYTPPAQGGGGYTPPAQNYTPPAQGYTSSQGGGGNTYTPPTQPAKPTQPPSSANASGIPNSPGGWDSPNNAEMGAWMP